MMPVSNCIENKIAGPSKKLSYAAIIGESPSKGARSPVLWNTAFGKLKLKALMHPFDVRSENLQSLVEALKKDDFYIGGAVTMPYKTAIIPFLDDLEVEARLINAVNCIYKKDGRLIGANTDGAGALWAVSHKARDLKGKNVLLLGTGGAGNAVAVYIAQALGKSGNLWLKNRTRATAEQLAVRLNDICRVRVLEHWTAAEKVFPEIDILINCTSVGFEHMKKDNRGYYNVKLFTPLGDIPDIRVTMGGKEGEKEYLAKALEQVGRNISQSLARLSSMQEPFVFDIIYQPRTTMLLSLAERLNYQTLNGLSMNLEQAVIAFTKTTRAAGIYKGPEDKIRAIMALAN